MELEVKESISLEDGVHKGRIEKVEYRTEPFEYTDIFVKEETSGYSLKYGCPTIITEKSRLGKLLAKFTKVVAGLKIDPELVLVGECVEFMSILKERTDKQGEFTEIVEDSIKPVPKVKL